MGYAKGKGKKNIKKKGDTGRTGKDEKRTGKVGQGKKTAKEDDHDS